MTRSRRELRRIDLPVIRRAIPTGVPGLGLGVIGNRWGFSSRSRDAGRARAPHQKPLRRLSRAIRGFVLWFLTKLSSVIEDNDLVESTFRRVISTAGRCRGER